MRNVKLQELEGGVVSDFATEMQKRITSNLEAAVSKSAELKKKFKEKQRPPAIVRRYLGVKKKASRELRSRVRPPTPKRTYRLMLKIQRAERAIRSFYRQKIEDTEQRA